MADELRIGLAGLLRKAQMEHDVDFLKEGVRVLSQALMEMGFKSTSERQGTSAAPGAPDSATATASAPGTLGLEPWS
jgi:hypothetical protein